MNVKKKGFTLIEVTLGLAFIGVLLVTIALIIKSVLNYYQKGLTIKTVNNVGNQLIEDFTSTVSSSPRKSLSDFCTTTFSLNTPLSRCLNDNAFRFSYVQHRASDIHIVGRDASDDINESVPVNGAFCTGNYSYIWNSGYVLSDIYVNGESHRATVKYLLPGNPTPIEVRDFRLLKIRDPSRLVCTTQIDYSSYESVLDDPATYDITRDNDNAEYALMEAPIELLSNDSSNIAIYDFSVYPPAQDDVSKRIIYSASFILGTISDGINITSNSDYCDKVDTSNGELGFEYCAINKFNFSMQTSGE